MAIVVVIELLKHVAHLVILQRGGNDPQQCGKLLGVERTLLVLSAVNGLMPTLSKFLNTSSNLRLWALMISFKSVKMWAM
jgi:hypothetical protein